MARNYDSQCRRMDLHLRAKFPYLNTIIYKMEKSSYKIFIENYKDFNQISDYFHHNIRYMATNVTLINITPDNFSSRLSIVPIILSFSIFNAIISHLKILCLKI